MAASNDADRTAPRAPSSDHGAETAQGGGSTNDGGEVGGRDTGAGRARQRRPRRLVVALLVGLATVLLVTSAVNLWVERQALDTDAWVSASDQMLGDDAVRGALSQYVVDQLYGAVDVGAELRQQLPEALQGLAGPVSAALRQPAVEAVDRLLDTPQVRQLWRKINREAHATLVRILEDRTRAGVSTTDGVVTLNLAELVRQVGSQLGLSQGILARIPAGAGTITLARSDQLKSAQQAVRIVNWLSAFLVILVVALYASAVYLARGWRRIALRNVGWCVVGASVFLLVVQRLVSRWAIDSAVEVDSYRNAARAVWVIASALLRQLAWTGVVIGVITLLYAFSTGPAQWARALRGAVAPVSNARPLVVWGGATALFVVLVVWAPIPAFRVLSSTIVMAILLAIGVEAFRRQTQAEFPDAALGGRAGAVGVAERARRAWAHRPTPGRPAATGVPSGVEHLERLSVLHAAGDLTDEEYAEAKRTALRLPPTAAAADPTSPPDLDGATAPLAAR